MSVSRKVTVATSLVLVFSLTSSIFLLRRLDQVRTTATLDEVLYLNSPKWVERLSLGYTGLLADIYWTRAVQYFGGKHVTVAAKDYRLLYPLLEITTELDPKLIVAYQFGANFLGPKPPEGAGQPDQAVALVEHGIRNNPDNWKLYYELGFIYYYMESKDYAKAAESFERGTKVPNAHPFLRVLAAQMAQHAGEIQTSRMLWQAAYATTQDPMVRNNATAHLRALQVDEDVTQLEKVVTAYQKRTGRLPSSINVLIGAGLLRGVPVDPDGKPYKLMPDGRFELRNPEDFPFVEQGLPPGYVPGPPKFH
jgi:tetratricopeptide (TPR) repeat protein